MIILTTMIFDFLTADSVHNIKSMPSTLIIMIIVMIKIYNKMVLNKNVTHQA